jgi:signal transduction histidine kinase
LQAVVDSPAGLPALPDAIEVAAYRIATEAMTNAVRHSYASTITVRVSCDDTLTVEVLDDGSPNGAWHAGVGLLGMHERAAELGGRCQTGPSPSGGRVLVALPLALA